MITLFGATGYTGQLIAHALGRQGLLFRLAGRSGDDLAELSAALPGRPTFLVADAAHPSSLGPLFQGTQLLINAAGPFTDLGEPVLSRAAMGGVRYLDTTNELGFVFRMRGYHTAALRSGAAVVPAAGFEVALADCAAAVLADRLGDVSAAAPVDQVDVVYAIKAGGISAGTRKSMVRTMATSWIAYRYGDWVGQVPAASGRKFKLPSGERPTFSFPSSESVTIPAHIPVRQVDTWMVGPAGVEWWGPVLFPIFARLARSIVRPLLLRFSTLGARLGNDGSADGARGQARFNILVSARRRNTRRWITLQGGDPYGITAEIIAYYAKAMMAADYDRSGLLAPAQAVDPHAVLRHAVEQWGLVIQEGEGDVVPAGE